VSDKPLGQKHCPFSLGGDMAFGLVMGDYDLNFLSESQGFANRFEAHCELPPETPISEMKTLEFFTLLDFIEERATKPAKKARRRK
jgi:hypothetical protein